MAPAGRRRLRLLLRPRTTPAPVTFIQREKRACARARELAAFLLEEDLGHDPAAREGKLRRVYRQAPAAPAVMLDGGRYQVRAEGAGRGVHDPGWRETKVACCQTYTGVGFRADPPP